MRTGNTELSDDNSKDNWFPDENRVKNNSQYTTKENYRKDKLASSEEEFDMYEIGNPDLLYTVQVQLFEKLISPDGKTVWNDMTKGEPASLSTLSPEWMVKDVSIRYRPKEAVARDCGPELMALQNDDSEETFSVSPILLPPRNTQSIRLDVPYEIPADVTHCLGEDPKLLCREMTEARQVAAGLSLRERVRHARSVCYHDVVSINMLITGFGVLIMLLFFGLLKGCFGLICRCVGSWGLHRIVQMPRKLEHYYESVLENRPVIYDSAGWPVHPDTKDRTVRLVSMYV
ncbi:putative synaptic vesicle protein 2 [Operophtera brumata]|uniref:Putative synaptic vesicle protein 2 n=1 Tax=Operophtera brumata TaxID=104452 RepID=A0A0L7LCG2_OPEBR|nr:putative synaptic vesicle protein 2 [Operophtera brumata]